MVVVVVIEVLLVVVVEVEQLKLVVQRLPVMLLQKEQVK